MVKLVEIEDESVYDDDSQYTTDDDSESLGSVEDKDVFSDEDYDSEFDEDDDYLLDESLLERITALKDIVPSHQRQRIANTFNSIYNWGSFGMQLAGKLSWIFTSSALLVVFPLALETDRDKMMQQWEKEQGMAPGQQPGMGPVPGIAGVPGANATPGLAGATPGLIENTQ